MSRARMDLVWVWRRSITLGRSMNPESVARRGRRPGDLRVVVRRPAKLPRTLGPSALFAACYGNVGATIVLIALLLAVTVIGIQESSVLNLVLAFTDLFTQFVLVILGLILLLNIDKVISSIHLGVAPTWGNFLASISIAMVTYTGIETISNLS